MVVNKMQNSIFSMNYQSKFVLVLGTNIVNLFGNFAFKKTPHSAFGRNGAIERSVCG